jgi:hypothetical protein
MTRSVKYRFEFLVFRREGPLVLLLESRVTKAVRFHLFDLYSPSLASISREKVYQLTAIQHVKEYRQDASDDREH